MIRNQLRRRLVVPTVIGLLALGASATGPAHGVEQPGAAADQATAKVTTYTGKVRALQRYGTTTAWPPAVTHPSGGAINLTEDGKLQRFVNRSNSPRPTTRRDSAGNRTLAQGAPSWLPVVTSTRVDPVTRPGARNGWEGLNEFDNESAAGFNVEPPDQGLCVGNGHVLEMINSVVRSYRLNGRPETPAVYLNTFFKEPDFQFATDPSCVYDAGSNRFFATQLTLEVDPETGELTDRNWIDLAVSRTGDPTAGFRLYRVFATDDGSDATPSHRDCPCFGDFPHLGTDANGVYITTNEYPFEGRGVFGNEFNGAQLYAINKRATVRGTATTLTQFENLRFGTTSGPQVVGFSLQPALSVGTHYATTGKGTMYFPSSVAAEEARPGDFSGHADRTGLWWLANTASLAGGAGSLVLRSALLGSESYGVPPLSNQKAGPVPLRDCLVVDCGDQGTDPLTPEQEGSLDSSDTRMLSAVFVGGTVVSLLDTAVSVRNNVQAGVAWVRYRVGQPPSIAAQGYVGTAGQNLIYPALATDTRGRGYVGITLAGRDWFPSAGYLAWNRSGPGNSVHLAAKGAAPEDGFCEYLFFNCAGTPIPQIRPRWGDYGAAAWTGANFFLGNEYIAHRCDFKRFAADPTCGRTRTFFGNFSTHIQRLAPRG
jgi:hypothetical protein